MIRRPRTLDDRGSALVEFFWLALLLMVPLVYLILTASAIQRSAYAVTQAAQQAARAYATAGSDALGQDRARQVATIAMGDQGIGSGDGPVIDCGPCSYEPGSTFTASVSVRVPLPLVPGWLCGHVCAAGVTVSAQHIQALGCFIGTGAPSAGSAC